MKRNRRIIYSDDEEENDKNLNSDDEVDARFLYLQEEINMKPIILREDHEMNLKNWITNGCDLNHKFFTNRILGFYGLENLNNFGRSSKHCRKIFYGEKYGIKELIDNINNTCDFCQCNRSVKFLLIKNNRRNYFIGIDCRKKVGLILLYLSIIDSLRKFSGNINSNNLKYILNIFSILKNEASSLALRIQAKYSQTNFYQEKYVKTYLNFNANSTTIPELANLKNYYYNILSIKSPAISSTPDSITCSPTSSPI